MCGLRIFPTGKVSACLDTMYHHYNVLFLSSRGQPCKEALYAETPS